MNNDTELFELCKEVYKRTGWVYNSGTNGTWFTDGYITLATWVEGGVPVYTSDYLLEKLPRKLAEPGYWLAVMPFDETSWSAGYLSSGDMKYLVYECDTPLKALLKLVIALEGAGVKL